MIIKASDLEFDEDDSSATRPFTALEKIVDLAGLRMVEKEKQRNFPDIGLYPIYTVALRPK